MARGHNQSRQRVPAQHQGFSNVYKKDFISSTVVWAVVRGALQVSGVQPWPPLGHAALPVVPRVAPRAAPETAPGWVYSGACPPGYGSPLRPVARSEIGGATKPALPSGLPCPHCPTNPSHTETTPGRGHRRRPQPFGLSRETPSTDLMIMK